MGDLGLAFLDITSLAALQNLRAQVKWVLMPPLEKRVRDSGLVRQCRPSVRRSHAAYHIDGYLRHGRVHRLEEAFDGAEVLLVWSRISQ